MRLLLTLLALSTACAANVKLHPNIVADGVPPDSRGHVTVAAVAEGVPETVGYGTITVFAIPVEPVKIADGPGERLVMDAIRDGLRAAGYTVTEAGAAAGGPTLECRVQRFRFRNYTWLWPVIPVWGTIAVDLRLVGAGGEAVWQRSYKGEYSDNATSDAAGFDVAVNHALEDVLRQAVTDFGEPAFHAACCGAERDGTPQ